jgi:putative PIN family toxin of toxin-antitoxin system
MKVFVDTNVLVSAVATRGLCADVLREILSSHQIIVSKPLFDEFRRILLHKFQVPKAVVEEAIEVFGRDAAVGRSVPLPDLFIRDEADRVILETALGGQAELFVTGDKELWELGQIGAMRIVSPREFWETAKSPVRRRRKPGRPR